MSFYCVINKINNTENKKKHYHYYCHFCMLFNWYILVSPDSMWTEEHLNIAGTIFKD